MMRRRTRVSREHGARRPRVGGGECRRRCATAGHTGRRAHGPLAVPADPHRSQFCGGLDVQVQKNVEPLH